MFQQGTRLSGNYSQPYRVALLECNLIRLLSLPVRSDPDRLRCLQMQVHAHVREIDAAKADIAVERDSKMLRPHDSGQFIVPVMRDIPDVWVYIFISHLGYLHKIHSSTSMWLCHDCIT